MIASCQSGSCSVIRLGRPDAATSSAGRTCSTRPATTIAAFSMCARRSEEHTSELQSQSNLVCRLLLEKKKIELERSAALPTSLLARAQLHHVPHTPLQRNIHAVPRHRDPHHAAIPDARPHVQFRLQYT